MWLGISKRVGPVRLVIGTNPFKHRHRSYRASRSSHSYHESQADKRANERQEFISTVSTEFYSDIRNYALAKGYVIPRNKPLDPSWEFPGIEKFKPLAEQFAKILRLLNDGGILTAKRRDTLLELHYQAGDLLAELDTVSPIVGLVGRYDRVQDWLWWNVFCLTILCWTVIPFAICPFTTAWCIVTSNRLKSEIRARAVAVYGAL